MKGGPLYFDPEAHRRVSARLRRMMPHVAAVQPDAVERQIQTMLADPRVIAGPLPKVFRAT